MYTYIQKGTTPFRIFGSFLIKITDESEVLPFIFIEASRQCAVFIHEMPVWNMVNALAHSLTGLTISHTDMTAIAHSFSLSLGQCKSLSRLLRN